MGHGRRVLGANPAPGGERDVITLTDWPDVMAATVLAVYWMTDAFDGREHAVDDEASAAGCRCGHYRAVCDREVFPRSIAAPPGARCEHCTTVTAPPPPTNPITRWLRVVRSSDQHG